MPFVNVKLIKNQTTLEQKNKIIQGLTDLMVSQCLREQNYKAVK